MELVQETPKRTLEEVQADYQKTCGMAGEVQFKMKALEGDLLELNKKLVSLHREANEIAKAKDEVKNEVV